MSINSQLGPIRPRGQIADRLSFPLAVKEIVYAHSKPLSLPPHMARLASIRVGLATHRRACTASRVVAIAAQAERSAEKRSYCMMLDRESYNNIFDNLYDGLYFVDRNRVIQYWNKAAERISGYPAEEVVGRSCSDNILTHVDGDGNNLCQGMCPLAKTITDGVARQAEVFLHHKDGHRVPISVRVSTLTDKEGGILGGVELFSDISNFKFIEMRVKELEAMALLDNLTGLANRNYLQKEFLMRCEEQKRFGIHFGVLFMDIDHFKILNDTYGHDAGDRVLKLVGTTLVSNSRPFDVFGRWGGEEFIGIIRNVTHQQLEHIGNRVRVLVNSSYITLENCKLQVSVSIGATLVRENDNMDTLLKRADTLLYESKREGRNRLTIG
jgi:diguanylate cyclase (GGDEF)-like protein/PAS domain S-box-containing protein